MRPPAVVKEPTVPRAALAGGRKVLPYAVSSLLMLHHQLARKAPGAGVLPHLLLTLRRTSDSEATYPAPDGVWCHQYPCLQPGSAPSSFVLGRSDRLRTLRSFEHSLRAAATAVRTLPGSAAPIDIPSSVVQQAAHFARSRATHHSRGSRSRIGPTAERCPLINAKLRPPGSSTTDRPALRHPALRRWKKINPHRVESLTVCGGVSRALPVHYDSEPFQGH